MKTGFNGLNGIVETWGKGSKSEFLIEAAQRRIAANRVMPGYRAPVLGLDGQFIKAIELYCPDDDVAIDYAKQLVDGHDVELWREARHTVVGQAHAGGSD